jgi:hypothetical protein
MAGGVLSKPKLHQSRQGCGSLIASWRLVEGTAIEALERAHTLYLCRYHVIFCVVRTCSSRELVDGPWARSLAEISDGRVMSVVG